LPFYEELNLHEAVPKELEHACNGEFLFPHDEWSLIEVSRESSHEMHAGGELRSRSLVFHEPNARRTGTSERTFPMRSTLLVSTAALLAGIGLASAQGQQGGGQSGAAPSAQSQGAQGGAAGQERQSPQSSPSQRGQKEPMQKDTTGQAPQRDQGAQGKADQDDKAQPQRSGQGQREQQSPAQAQSPQRQQNQDGQAAQGQAQQGSKGGGNATLTTEQRTTIRKTVLSGGNVPRATNVNFTVSVGTTVPTSVRVVAVPPTLIEIYPEWRGHMYFVVNDEIIIVDRNHRIIAVLPV
jgi:hypothetical protein